MISTVIGNEVIIIEKPVPGGVVIGDNTAGGEKGVLLRRLAYQQARYGKLYATPGIPQAFRCNNGACMVVNDDDMRTSV